MYQMDENGTIANMITSEFELEVKNVENVPHERNDLVPMPQVFSRFIIFFRYTVSAI